MNLRHMEVFRTIYQAKSVGGAARILGVSQPSVSRMYHNFEHRLGYKLFRLRKGRIVPTYEAEQLIKEIDNVFETVERVDRLASDLKEGAGERISVVAAYSLAAGLLPSTLEIISRRHPKIRISLDAQNLTNQFNSVRRSEADIGISTNVPQTPGFERRQLGKSHFVAIIHKDHALSKRKSIKLSDFCDWPCIIAPPDSPMGIPVHLEFRKRGLEPNIAATMKMTLLGCEMISSFQSIGILDNLTIRLFAHPDLVVKPLNPAFGFSIQAFWLSNNPLSHTQLELLDILEKRIRSLDD